MKVTGWADFEDGNYCGIDEMTDEEFEEAWNAVVNEVRTKGYKLHGGTHQHGYCPILDDKWIFGVSMRQWGAIMRQAYDLPNDDGLGYVYWAWSTPNDEKEILPSRS